MHVPDLYRRFLAAEQQQRRKIEAMPLVGGETIRALLEAFDSEVRRLERLRTFVGRTR